MLVLRPGALGDTLLAVPALRALRRRFGEAVTLAAHGETARLLAALGEVDFGLAFDDPRLRWLFQPDARGSNENVVAWLDATRLPGLTDALVIGPSRPPGTEVHCASHLLATLGFEAELDERPLEIQPLATNDVLIHPGSGSPLKNWPAERFASVIGHLDGHDVRLIVGEADGDAALRVERCLGRRVPRLEAPTLAELAARLAGCRAYLGNDSGVSHLAGLCGARTVAVFGPTPSVVWQPLGPRVIVRDFGSSPESVAADLTS